MSNLVAPLPDELVPAAAALFGEYLDGAQQYAELLATDGVIRGLIGPREAPRIWDRHVLNCAAMAEFIPLDSSVIDVGSGAGLPGIVLAIARPDLTVVLIEPLARRTVFLDEVVEQLSLSDRVTVVRARAEEAAKAKAMFHVKQSGTPFHVKHADVVTARAVAPLDRLVGWCLPLTKVGGHLLAMKGSSAAEEVVEHQNAIVKLGGGTPLVRECGGSVLPQSTYVVDVVRERDVTRPESRSRRPGR